MKTVAMLDETVAKAFYGRFPELRDVQKAAIEPLVSNRNVVLTSGTGSGKTEAVMAPILSNYWRQALKNNCLFLLYIAPTKALANDLEKRLVQPLSQLNIRIGIRHGDRDDLAKGKTPHVLITTPESLDVLLARQEQMLGGIKSVVMDEVHLLYNTQRGLQLSILLARLRRFTSYDFQWAALSATIGDLSYVRDFIVGKNSEADLLSYSTNRPIDAQIRHAESLRDFVKLIRKLTDGRNTKLLVFANSRHECEKLTGALQEDQLLSRHVVTHYSSLSAQIRVETERKYASMGTAVCVGTSTLELGIDIGDIDVVLLWGVPHSVDSFLQRIGRGNRRSNKTNVVCVIPSNSETVEMDSLRFAALLDSARKGELPVQEPYDLFGAVAQQCLSIIASHNGKFIRIADLYDYVSHKESISRETLESVLAELASNGFLQKHGYKNRYGAEERLYSLVDMRLIYGNFPIGTDMVDLFQGTKHLGEIPKVNLLTIRKGTSFRFGGKYWRVQRISDQDIHVEQTGKARVSDEIFFGVGEEKSQPYLTNYVWSLIHESQLDKGVFTSGLGAIISSFMQSIRTQWGQFQIPYRKDTKGITYLTFAGYIVNRAIGKFTDNADFSADNISLTVKAPIDWRSLPANPNDYEDCFPALFEATSEQSYYQKQLPLELQAHEYIQNWLKDRSIQDVLTRVSQSEPVKLKTSPAF